MQGGVRQPFLVRFQHAGVAAETGGLGALAVDAGRDRLHRVGGVAAGTDRRITVFGVQPRLRVHAAEVGGVDIGVAVLARRLFDRCRRALDDGMRVMTVGADRRRRIAVADQRGVNAAVPLLEFVGVAGAAYLGHGERKAALAGDVVFLGRVLGGIDVGMAAGAAVGAVDGLDVAVARHVQLQDVAVRQLFLHAGGAVAAEAILIGLGGRRVGGECGRRGR